MKKIILTVYFVTLLLFSASISNGQQVEFSGEYASSMPIETHINKRILTLTTDKKSETQLAHELPDGIADKLNNNESVMPYKIEKKLYSAGGSAVGDEVYIQLKGMSMQL